MSPKIRLVFYFRGRVPFEFNGRQLTACFLNVINFLAVAGAPEKSIRKLTGVVRLLHPLGDQKIIQQGSVGGLKRLPVLENFVIDIIFWKSTSKIHTNFGSRFLLFKVVLKRKTSEVFRVFSEFWNCLIVIRFEWCR